VSLPPSSYFVRLTADKSRNFSTLMSWRLAPSSLELMLLSFTSPDLRLAMETFKIVIIMSRRESQAAPAIEMLHRYPFEEAEQPGTVVRLTRRFRDNEYEQLRSKVEAHSKLRSPTLIRIMKATVNRNAHHFNIFFEHVPFGLRHQISDLTIKQIR
jgi:hypothetical protein